ncbi:DUF934 domain-containing protein [Parasphingorhabdus sp. JC815]|uniref:DUF934 domain-containing protein n=1 Tax=Parasphingorhabdus sp. JC815 TaxID=3232140 RepID=UPI003457F505
MTDILRYRDDDAPMEPVVTISAFSEQSNSSAVLIEAGDDARDLLPYLDRLQLVVIDFPRFRDGRGYSSARILRESGYKGEIRAVGDVLVDQIWHMRRCGFDSFAPNSPLDPEVVEKSLNRYEYVYQSAADDAVPIWKLRHE